MSGSQNRLYKVKEYVQTAIFLFEVGIFIFIILTLFSKLEYGYYFYWFEEIKSFEFMGKVTIIFAFYQLLTYSFMRLRLSSRQDVILAKHTLVKTAIILVQFDQSLDPVIKRCNLFLDKKNKVYMINAEDYKELIKINNLTSMFLNDHLSKADYLYSMKSIEIALDHDSRYNALTWKNSILLNIFK